MAIEFDPINKLILITSPTVEISALEIYSLAMDWCDSQLNIGYSIPIRADGKFWMKTGVYSDSIFRLINGWKIKFWSGDYQAIITGTLLPEEGETRTVPPDTGNVEVIFEVSSQATIITGNGGGITQQDKEDIAGLVWSHTTGQTLAERVNLLRQIEQGKWKIENNTMIIYENDGITELLKFELFGKDGVEDLTEGVYERRPI